MTSRPGGPAGHNEAGFTMVELMVALTVLAVGVVGVIGVLGSAFAVAGTASVRARAVALATQEIEAHRAIPYHELAVTPDVVTRTETATGHLFDVTTAVTWADEVAASAVAVADAYKQVTVVVAWTDRSGRHDVHQTTIVYPGGLGTHAGTPTSVPADNPFPPPRPEGLMAALPPGVEGETSVDLSWTLPAGTDTDASGFAVQYSTDSFATTTQVSASIPASSRALRVVGLSAATPYHFRVAARGADGQLSPWSDTAAQATAPSSTPGCVIGTPAVTPSSVSRTDGGNAATLTADPLVSVNTSGDCAGLYVTYEPTNQNAAMRYLTPASGGVFTAVLAGTTTAWDVGRHYIELYDHLGVQRGSVLLTVCHHNARSCR